MSSEPSPETVAVTKVLTGDKNERGIPKVVFIVRGEASKGLCCPPPPLGVTCACAARRRTWIRC